MVFENGKILIYVAVLRAIYGMIVAFLLFYKKFCGDLENIGFEFNPYYPCVSNRIKVGKQHTVRFHVDEVISSHIKPKVNGNLKEWVNLNYVKHDKVNTNRGKVHEYLGITFDFTEELKVKIKTDDYVERIINDFPMKIM